MYIYNNYPLLTAVYVEIAVTVCQEYTVFAPSDDAWREAEKHDYTSRKDFSQILQYHIIDGAVSVLERVTLAFFFFCLQPTEGKGEFLPQSNPNARIERNVHDHQQ